jgi:chlorobactene glucosyltransferase
MVYFHDSNSETLFFTALFFIMILSCHYLKILSSRSRLLIPIIESNQKGLFRNKNLKPKKDNNHHLILNKGYLMDGINKNNDNPFLPNHCYNIDKDNKENNGYSDKKLLTNFPFVSVIVPARNEEKYIERCLLSLLSQDYPNFEIIAVDDNSSDNTLKIMKDIKNKIRKKTNTGLLPDKLKIISLKIKPDGWTGKTWASEQGYLQSKGTILLFTDADTNYVCRDVILQTVLFMQKEGLDVLTGVCSPEKLSNFWAKITIPLWDFVSILFGIGSGDVNNPKSKIAYLMGSFFLVRRKVVTAIGAFESVRDEIQEDKALGVIIKKRGYNLRAVILKEMMYTLWVDDLATLWDGIGRTLAPLVMKNRFKVISNLFIIFFATILPFVLFPVTLSIAVERLSLIPIYQIAFNIYLYLPLLNLIPCIMVFISFSTICKVYKIKSFYSLGSLFAAIFVISACTYNIASLMVFGKTSPIMWQGREYIYNKEQSGFTI